MVEGCPTLPPRMSDSWNWRTICEGDELGVEVEGMKKGLCWGDEVGGRPRRMAGMVR